jgi:hypothetical protein
VPSLTVTDSILGDAHNRGRKADKHGNPWRVYEVNHTNLMAQYNRFILEKVKN